MPAPVILVDIKHYRLLCVRVEEERDPIFRDDGTVILHHLAIDIPEHVVYIGFAEEVKISGMVIYPYLTS